MVRSTDPFISVETVGGITVYTSPSWGGGTTTSNSGQILTEGTVAVQYTEEGGILICVASVKQEGLLREEWVEL